MRMAPGLRWKACSRNSTPLIDGSTWSVMISAMFSRSSTARPSSPVAAVKTR